MVKDPERPAGSKPGREKQGCVGRRVLEASAPPPPPCVGQQDQGAKPKLWELGAGTSGSMGRGARNPDFYILKKGRNQVLSHQGVWWLSITDF